MTPSLAEKMRHPKFIDLNQDAGDSFWGLTRQQAKSIAMFLIISSLFLMTPPGAIDPTDVLNIAMARWMTEYFSISAPIALTIAYTLIPWAIFLLGIYIYPANTQTIFNGYLHRLKRMVKRLFRDLPLLALFVLMGIIVFQYYLKLVGG